MDCQIQDYFKLWKDLTKMNYKKMIIELEENHPSGCRGSLIPGVISKGSGQTFIVFGLNPAEAHDDIEDFYNSKFYIINPEELDTFGQQRWTKKISDILPEDANIIQAELIYWTSKNRSSLEKRIGNLEFGNPYFDLSCQINYDLLSKYNNAKCILLGFSHKDLFEKLFDLPEFDMIINGQNGRRLIGKHKGNNKFCMVRHPSSIGFSNIDKKSIQKLLSHK